MDVPGECEENVYSAVGGGRGCKSPQSKVMDSAAQASYQLCRLDFTTTNRGLFKPPAMICICQFLLPVPSVLHSDVSSKHVYDHANAVFGKKSILGTAEMDLCRCDEVVYFNTGR